MSTMSAGTMKVYVVCCKGRERFHQCAPWEVYSARCFPLHVLPGSLSQRMVSFKLSLVNYLFL